MKRYEKSWRVGERIPYPSLPSAAEHSHQQEWLNVEDRNSRKRKHPDGGRYNTLFPSSYSDMPISDNRKEKRRLKYEKTRLFKGRQGWMAVDIMDRMEEWGDFEVSAEETFIRRRERLR